jgi:DNA-binding transcriptional MerR regulator
MKTKELADWLGVSPATIRLWATDGEYGRYLTPSGAGGDGRTRHFDDIDARVVAYVSALKARGRTRREIYGELEVLKADNWLALPPMPAAPPGMGAVHMVPESTAQGIIITERAKNSEQIRLLQDRIDELREELADERTEKEKLMRELAEAQTELRLWREGWRKPK